MIGEKTEVQDPPALPGEVFRAEIVVVGEPWIVCIAPGVEADDGPVLRAWRWVPWADPLPKLSRWRERGHAECVHIFAAWALHERVLLAASMKVVDALPKCDVRQHDLVPFATRQFGTYHLCDACAVQFVERQEEAVDLPYAAPLRAMLAKERR